MQRHGAKGSVTNDSRSEHEQKCQEDFFIFFFSCGQMDDVPGRIRESSSPGSPMMMQRAL